MLLQEDSTTKDSSPIICKSCSERLNFCASANECFSGVPIFFGLLIIWKVIKRTRWIPSSEADLYTGKAALDAVVWPERHPRNMIERIWFWIA